ncbi:MAG: 4'-phosphopantetheinyl transferase superfamily protein [Gammaproteobacteria bacterium]|nr:4'-phosphopantetheinyl transferase superfamily protein [Gammaproteobacteria bacterium]MDH5801637.1 4'-phosphopantetheinyl transferase superfamily protein [Gammaproteobacteria bacterium]
METVTHRENEILVYVFPLREYEKYYSLFSRLLNNIESLRADSYRFVKDKIQFVIVRAILKLILASHLDQNPKSIVLQYTRYGKPYLPGSKLQFSVTHSSGWAAIALCYGRRLGIDLESVRHRVDMIGLAKEFFCEQENELLQNARLNVGKIFFNLWVQKEAVLKATGSGIAQGLDALDLSQELLSPRVVQYQDRHWFLFPCVFPWLYIPSVTRPHESDSAVCLLPHNIDYTAEFSNSFCSSIAVEYCDTEPKVCVKKNLDELLLSHTDSGFDLRHKVRNTAVCL